MVEVAKRHQRVVKELAYGCWILVPFEAASVQALKAKDVGLKRLYLVTQSCDPPHLLLDLDALHTFEVRF
jgi:hypothetical protein